jgi:hypothetical protein
VIASITHCDRIAVAQRAFIVKLLFWRCPVLPSESTVLEAKRVHARQHPTHICDFTLFARLRRIRAYPPVTFTP